MLGEGLRGIWSVSFANNQEVDGEVSLRRERRALMVVSAHMLVPHARPQYFLPSQDS